MKLRGVYFDNIHTGEDWGLTMSVCQIDPPTPKTYFVSVEGRDGDLDFTEALDGETHFESRNAEFEFILTDGTHAEREELISLIYAFLHGRTRQLRLPDYPDYYMTGRFEVTEHTNTLAYGTVKISATLDPWKYKIIDTVVSATASGTDVTFALVNKGRRTALPTFKVTGSITLLYGSSSFGLSAGEYTIPEIVLKTGTTLLTVRGTGTITATYKEGIL